MKRIWRRALCAALAAQLLLGLASPALAAAEPYYSIHYNWGYSPYAGENMKCRFSVENGAKKGGIDTGESGSIGDSWEPDAAGAYTLNSLEASLKNKFLAQVTSRVPDRKFAGWTVYTGNKMSAGDFLDMHGSDILDPDGGIVLGQFDGIVQAKDENGGEAWKGTGKLPLVGRWELSDRAGLLPSQALQSGGYANTAFSGNKGGGWNQLYDGDLAMLSEADLAGQKGAHKIDFTQEREEYYLRVTAETELLDLQVVALEPYALSGLTAAERARLDALDENERPGVHVTVTDTEGHTTQYPAHPTVLNDSRAVDLGADGTVYENKVNSAAYPARSLWTAGGLALTQSAGAGKYYNVVTVTVVAPDGVGIKQYVFHIQRLGVPLLTAQPGNTPVGMIARDSKIKDKAAARQAFEKDRRFGAYWPEGTENQTGAVYNGVYHPQAWADAGNYDPDLDNTSIVAYHNSAFTVPGFTVTDSAGNRVEDYGSAIGYDLKLRQENVLTWSGVLNPAGGAEIKLTPCATKEDGSVTYDLCGVIAAPGIYSLEYSFRDPVSGRTYTSADAAGFKRTLVLLPIPGDVDMDGAVTMADALAMEEMLGSAEFQAALAGGDPVARLLAYRVGDVNGDGVFDAKDAAAVWAGYSPLVKYNATVSHYFYLPLTSGIAGEERKAAPAADGTKPTLTLDYLGTSPAGLGEMDGATLDGQLYSGSILSKNAEYGTGVDGLQVGDVFWVGVRLTVPAGADKGSALTLGVAAAAMSIAYDKALVEPAALDGLSWAATILKYNMRKGGDGVDTAAMWSADYTVAASSAQTGPYAPANDALSSSKALLPLETLVAGRDGKEWKSNLRELRVALSLNGGLRRVLSSDNMILLRVPFKLVSHPHNEDTIRALELSLGPRELAFSGYSSGDSSGARVSTVWDNSTAAPSAFGGVTGNLAAQLSYGGGTALVLRLGTDNTEYAALANTKRADGRAVYGEAFSAFANVSGMTPGEQANLPAGLNYTSSGSGAGYITGIPRDTGVFTFYVGKNAYQITVEKTVLELTATPGQAYYGESLPVLTFTYNTSQVKELDKSGGFANGGAGGDLQSLRGYVSSPILRAVKTPLNGTTEPVAKGTAAGKYYITLTGGENKYYTYSYKRAGYNGESFEFNGGYGTLEILRRPVVIEKILTGTIATIMFDGTQTAFNMTGSYQGGDLAVRSAATAGGMYNGLPLSAGGVYSGDELLLNYTATYVKIAGKDGGVFTLDAPEERRDMAITNWALKPGPGAGGNANYVLADPYVDTAGRTAKDAGVVIDRPASKVAITKNIAGMDMPYSNGARLDLAGLTVAITYGTGSSAKTVSLEYNNRSSFDGNRVLVTWEDGVDVTTPTLGNNVMEMLDETNHTYRYFTLEAGKHNDKYLYVWVPTSTVDGGAPGYQYTHTDRPLSVSKTMLLLSVDRVSRYYGEKNPEITFTYDPAQLPESERALITERMGRTPIGKGDELEYLDGYDEQTKIVNGVKTQNKLKIEVREGYIDSAPLVTAATTARQGVYLSIISGGGAANIDFKFTQLGEGEFAVGFQYFDIYPRPIVVSEIVMASGEVDSDYFLYDDTKDTQLVTMTYGAETRRPTATINGTEKGGVYVDRFSAELPAGSYYIADNSNTAKALKYSLTGPAVLPGDQEALTLIYQANYQRDNTAAPYFTMTEGTKRQTADIRGIAISGTDNAKRNYTLVYKTNRAATYGMPIAETATGTIRLRAIKSVGITLAGGTFRTSYTYGDQLSLNGMSLTVTFESEGDNNPARNQAVRTESYSTITSGGVVIGNSFAKLGLSVGWAPREGSGDDILATARANPATYGSYPTAAGHSGRQLVVYGRRNEGHAMVYAVTGIAGGVAVAKKTLPLVVAPQYRYYGEANPQYTFTFKSGDLARPDSELLTARGLTALGGSASATGAPAGSAALSALGGYVGPKFATGASSASHVGIYALALSEGGLDNYTFRYTDATIQVFRRPIVISKVTKSPVYTIYYDNALNTFSAAAGSKEFAAGLPALAGGKYVSQKDADYVKALGNTGLPLTGSGVLASDVESGSISLSFNAIFPEKGNRVSFPAGAAVAAQPVTVATLSLATGAGDYILVYSSDSYERTGRPEDNSAMGRLDKRNIKKIEVVAVPRSTYTYGDGLDLSNLQVKITYEEGEVEGGSSTEIVPAASSDRLYVNYYNSAAIPEQSRWGSVTGTYRPAASGDHLTIAPDHDTRFSTFGQANGKYLIVSAQVDSTLGFVKPVIVPAAMGSAQAYQITVKPLELTYTLAAADKTYDGDTRAVGTLAFTNAYRRGGITDVVYAVTGAEYEKTGTDYSAYTEFLSRVGVSGYTFSSGSYDGGTGALTYTGGTYGDGAGKLTFAFVDPNVNYRNSPTWDSYGELATRKVEVTGIRLGGPDAANYAINPTVLRDTAAAMGRPAAPEATIRKAYRAAPAAPSLEADINTNAVKVSMGQDAAVYNPTAFDDQYAAELHYEYRLGGWAADAADGPAQMLEGAYQDRAFFGGEPIAFPLPVGYEPAREPDPPKKDDIVKGQSYRWAEEDDRFGLNENGLPMREALNRDWFYRAQVRLAETHNYLASPPAASVDDAGLSAAAAAASAVAREAADALVKRAEAVLRRDKDKPAAYPDPAPLLKTYPQRITVVSTADEQGKDGNRYTVTTLESVWFTDVLEYRRKEVLSSVLENFDPVRYYRYFWDPDQSKELEFKADDPLNLGTELTVSIRERQADGSTAEKTVTVNPAELGGHSALLYATTQPENSSVYIRTIDLSPTSIAARVGDAPVQITASYKPTYATNKKLTWTSSNSAVAFVTADGLVTFLSPGSATISVRAVGGVTAHVEVTVGPAIPFRGVFDRELTKPFLTMTPELAFLPERVMNRGELAIMLARVYVDNPAWTGRGSGIFPDVTGREGYAAAVRLLGEKGVLTGVTGGRFAASLTATRAEMAVIITRMMGLEIKDTKGQPHAFSDAGEHDTWAYAYIDALAAAGVVKGSGGGRFNPGGILTRAEAACMLSRILDGELDLTGSGLVHPIDVPPAHWGYREIMRAVNGLPEMTKKP